MDMVICLRMLRASSKEWYCRGSWSFTPHKHICLCFNSPHNCPVAFPSSPAERQCTFDWSQTHLQRRQPYHHTNSNINVTELQNAVEKWLHTWPVIVWLLSIVILIPGIQQKLWELSLTICHSIYVSSRQSHNTHGIVLDITSRPAWSSWCSVGSGDSAGDIFSHAVCWFYMCTPIPYLQSLRIPQQGQFTAYVDQWKHWWSCDHHMLVMWYYTTHRVTTVSGWIDSSVFCSSSLYLKSPPTGRIWSNALNQNIYFSKLISFTFSANFLQSSPWQPYTSANAPSPILDNVATILWEC